MKYVKIIVPIILLLGFGLLWFIGRFAPVNVEEVREGGYTVIGKNFTGPYQEVGPVYEEVTAAMQAMEIEFKQGLGIYNDDPESVPAEVLRSFHGFIAEDPSKLDKEAIRAAGLLIKEIPESPSCRIGLPARSMVSYMIHPARAYPALKKHLMDSGFNANTIYERYDQEGKMVYYVALQAEVPFEE